MITAFILEKKYLNGWGVFRGQYNFFNALKAGEETICVIKRLYQNMDTK